MRPWSRTAVASVVRTCTCVLQLQELMLQMAAQAAAHERKPDRSVANSTSTLWPLQAPEQLQPQQASAVTSTTDSLFAPSASLLPYQPQHTAGAATPTSGNRSGQDSGPEARHISAVDQTADDVQSSGQLSSNPAAAATGPSHGPNAERLQQHAAEETNGANADSASMHKSGLQLTHHDASQPWGMAWKQPSLAPVKLPLGQSGLGKLPSGPHQHRRATASDVPLNGPGPQQGSARPGNILHAARSLSWGNQTAETPQLHQHGSGTADLLEPSAAQKLLLHSVSSQAVNAHPATQSGNKLQPKDEHWEALVAESEINGKAAAPHATLHSKLTGLTMIPTMHVSTMVCTCCLSCAARAAISNVTRQLKYLQTGNMFHHCCDFQDLGLGLL